MINVKIKTPNPKAIQARLNKFVNNTFMSSLNSSAVPMIKKLIQSGQSPVQGHGRFPQYKDRLKYPGGRKPATPVNLTLSGKMLSLYKAFKKTSRDFALGYEKVSDDLEGQIIGNNEGKRKIPKRRFIPQKGEVFTVSVMRVIKDLYAKRISQLFK